MRVSSSSRGCGAKTAYKVVEVLGQGSHFRDEIIEVGQYRSNPCRHRLRLVSVLWGGTWYRYLTNVLDPEKLSAREVCALPGDAGELKRPFC